MSYSIYSKLRAIYSFLPNSEDIENLLLVHGASDFRNRLEKMSLLRRFPLMDNDLEAHLKMIPFSLAKVIGRRIAGSSAFFFDAYLRGYELQDIKNIIRGGRGVFIEELRNKRLSVQELDEYMQKKFWKDSWNIAYSEYKDRQNKIDLEISLDHFYYSYFFKETGNLPYEERYETGELILILINFKNRLYMHRLKKFYDLEDFEIKRFLIPEGEVYESTGEQKGISEDIYLREFTRICYKDFKFKMYTMRAILAFFFLLTIRMNDIISIYRAKLLQLEREQLKGIRSELYVGS
jgi:vacuolar-type H+-ATPase subunit C/Vma6